MSTSTNLLRRREVIDALRRGAVPKRGLDLYATGMTRFEKTFEEELESVAAGRGVFKALRGDFGCGKSFTARWLQQFAQARGFATSEVQISENDTPLHRLETVYRRVTENLRTPDCQEGAFRALVENWFFGLEDEAMQSGADPENLPEFTAAVAQSLEARLAEVSAIQPQFAAALRTCHHARVHGDQATVDGLMAWLMGQPNVGASIKRQAGIKGDLDHTGALAFLRGLLVMLRQTGRKGLILVLDEVETIQRVRGDVRNRSLNALRQLIDDVSSERFPGLYLMITGTPAFYDGPQGVKRLEPLAQRLHVEFGPDPAFDSTRSIQVRLSPFNHARLVEVGKRVRDIYPSDDADRITAKVNDEIIEDLASGVAGKLGGKTGIAPRIFLRKLVGELLDKVDEHPTYEPRQHFKLVVDAQEMKLEERAASGIETDPNAIALDLGESDPE